MIQLLWNCMRKKILIEWKIGLTTKEIMTFTYAGLRQVIDKYLVQDRSSGDVFETPQFMYMMISATLFAKYPKRQKNDIC